jgi:hypothetical protein
VAPLLQSLSLGAHLDQHALSGFVLHVLSTHSLSHMQLPPQPNCYFENSVAAGDHRLGLSGPHLKAADVQDARRRASLQPRVRAGYLEPIEADRPPIDKGRSTRRGRNRRAQVRILVELTKRLAAAMRYKAPADMDQTWTTEDAEVISFPAPVDIEGTLENLGVSICSRPPFRLAGRHFSPFAARRDRPFRPRS